MEVAEATVLNQYKNETTVSPMLTVSVGHASDTSGNHLNEDFFGSVTPLETGLAAQGMLFAIADGLSGGSGRAAAEAIVYSVLTDYYSTPTTMSTRQALAVVIGAVNRWLYAQNNQAMEDQAMVTTLSTLVLNGTHCTIAHVGDTRIYRWRDGTLRRLTTDHVWRSHGQQRVLRRALGLDADVLIDYWEDEVKAGDVFLLVSDGVWETIKEAEMSDALVGQASPQKVAQSLVEQAVLRGRLMVSNDATLAVVLIEAASC